MKEKNIQIDGINVFYREILPSKIKSTFLILHGWGGNSITWVQVGKTLRDSGNRVIIPDLPGFGETKLPEVFDLDKYANFIEKLIKKLELKDIILLGHSNGGAISIKICTRNNSSIKKLILNNSAGIRNNSFRLIKRNIFLFISLTLKSFINLLNLEKHKLYHKSRIFFYKLIGSSDYINSEKSEFLNETYKNVINSDLREELSKIKVETLLVWGSKDTYTPMSDAKIFKKKIANSHLVVLKGEKHGIHLFNPNRLAKSILDNL